MGGGGARGGVQNVHNCRASLLLGSYCLPFGRRVGEYMYIFQNISLCWIYAANNFVSICKLNIYVGVGYSSLGIIFGAVGGRVGKYTFFKIYIIGYIQFTIWGINVVMKYVMPTVGG